MKKICSLLLSTTLCVAIPALADDTSVYGGTTISLKPNVMILFDNSGSMGAADVGTANRIRMVVAKEVVAKLINDNANDVNFGVMKFNAGTPNSYHHSVWDKRHESGFLVAKCGADKSTLIGNYHLHDPSVAGDPPTTVFTNSNQADLGVIGNMRSGGYTPLAESAVEAGLYFAGKTSWYNGPTATGFPTGRFNANCTMSTSASPHNDCQDYSDDTPIEWRCQKNYLIIMTDGAPTRDRNPKMTTDSYIYSNKKIPDANKDGAQDYLDDIAYFLHEYDLRVLPASPTEQQKLAMGIPGDPFEKQTITTYTIGFQSSQVLLQNTASNGGGSYYTASNADQLSSALNSIITSIKDDNASFAAASVPVSQTNKAYAGNSVYYGSFKPIANGNWLGNVKKYFVSDMGEIKQWCAAQDATCPDATDSNHEILDNAKSYWLTTGAPPDGPYVNKGGAGAKLQYDTANTVTRHLYTYLGTQDSLTHTANSFKISNTLLPSVLTDLTITAVRHEDDTWPLGSFLHSQPLVAHYDTNFDGILDNSVIYAGANDGMLHAFHDNDGRELWGFIPPDLFNNLYKLNSPTNLEYFIDGTPVLYTYNIDPSTHTDKKLIIFGERRGGSSYTALDVTDYDSPIWKYTIAENFLRYTDDNNTPADTSDDMIVGEFLGQSWFTPQIATMGYIDINDDNANGNTTEYLTKECFLMTGGYDTNQDSLTPAANDAKGRAFFAIDAKTGTLFDNFNFNAHQYPTANLTHSIITLNGFENPKSRTTTRVYAADLNGNVWAVRDDIFHHNLDRTNTTFGGLFDGKEDGIWQQLVKFTPSTGQKIFYAPNIVNDYFPVTILLADGSTTETQQRVGDYVFYGTGDRANPDRVDIENAFYAIKNNWDWGTSPIAQPTLSKAYIDAADGGKIKIYADQTNLVRNTTDPEIASNAFFILDVTNDLYQNNDPDDATRELYTNYVSDAINRTNNRGWFIRFLDENGSNVGEKMTSTPIIFGGVIYFTTYVPADTTAPVIDICADSGALGTGYLYAIGYNYGEAVLDYENDPTDPGGLRKRDRKKTLSKPGIPPQPVLSIHEGKPTLITGFETDDPKFTQGLNRFYWRQINR